MQHVADCVAFTAYTNINGTDTPVFVTLLDGSAVIMEWETPQLTVAHGEPGVSVCGLNVVGGVGHSMTLMYNGTSGGSSDQSVNLVGHDAT